MEKAGGKLKAKGILSRREFLRGGSLATLGALTAGSLLLSGLGARGLGGHDGQWYEVVQDLRDGRRWHVNLFAGERVGDLEHARHLGRRVVLGDVGAVKRSLDRPARLQYRDGRGEQVLPG